MSRKQNAARGKHGLYLFLFLALVVTACARLPRALAQTTDPATVGQWSVVQSWPIVAVHSHMLPTGKVFFWAYSDGSGYYLWDPATGAITSTPNAAYNTFCSGHSFLPDGRLHVSGGHVRNGFGLNDASIYDPFTNSWTRLPDMNKGRWYPSSTMLASGDVLVTSGSYNTRYANNTVPQVYQVATNTWRTLSTASLALALYPHSFLSPDGRVFFATQTSRYLDTSGTGSWATVGNQRTSGRENYGSSAMYADGKVLFTGGADPPAASCEIIDLNSGTPAWAYTGSMSSARRQHNVTILPDGKVRATGGSSAAGFNEPSGAVLFAESWDPATGQWTRMANYQRYRGYHSTAMLLPDGRVLSAGGDNEPNAEVYSPPYLFKGARPSVTSGPASVTYGQTFSVQTPDSAAVTNVNWVRIGSLTHAQNWDQRINRLAFTAGTGTLNVTAPSSRNLCPPGHYMLFILNGNGVPSVARIVRIG